MSWSAIRRGVRLILLPGLPIILTVNDLIGGLVRIRGPSMAPALNDGAQMHSCGGASKHVELSGTGCMLLIRCWLSEMQSAAAWHWQNRCVPTGTRLDSYFKPWEFHAGEHNAG